MDERKSDTEGLVLLGLGALALFTLSRREQGPGDLGAFTAGGGGLDAVTPPSEGPFPGMTRGPLPTDQPAKPPPLLLGVPPSMLNIPGPVGEITGSPGKPLGFVTIGNALTDFLGSFGFRTQVGTGGELQRPGGKPVPPADIRGGIRTLTQGPGYNLARQATAQFTSFFQGSPESGQRLEQRLRHVGSGRG